MQASDRDGVSEVFIGSRLGLGVPIAGAWRLRLDLSLAAVASLDGAGLVSWLSLLAETSL